MSTAPVLVTPAPRSEPPAFAVPQPERHLRLIECDRQLAIDEIFDVHPIRRNAGAEQQAPVAEPPATEPSPAAKTFARTYFTAVAEVLVGRRSADQLMRHTHLPVLQWLRSLTPRKAAHRSAPPPRLLAAHTCAPREGVLEVTAVIQHGPHVKAMAGRFLMIERQWKCVELQLV